MRWDNNSDLARIYDGAKELFLYGEHNRALERFKCIYEVDCTFRDVADIVNDYYDLQQEHWVAEHQERMRDQHGKT